MIRRFALLLLAALTVLAGCTTSSSGGKHATKPASSAPAPAATSSSGTPTRITQPTSVPASVPNRTGVITGRLVALTSCQAVAGGWQAQGTAKGGSSRKTTYTITVFFTTDRATVQAFGQTKVTVTKGRSTKWTVTERFKAAPKTVCVLRGAG